MAADDPARMNPDLRDPDNWGPNGKYGPYWPCTQLGTQELADALRVPKASVDKWTTYRGQRRRYPPFVKFGKERRWLWWDVVVWRLAKLDQ